MVTITQHVVAMEALDPGKYGPNKAEIVCVGVGRAGAVPSVTTQCEGAWSGPEYAQLV